MRRLTTILFLITAFLNTSLAQEKILFKLNPELGKAITYSSRNEATMGDAGKILDIAMNIEISPQAIKDTIIHFEGRIKSIKMDMEMMGIVYDSTVESDDEMSIAMNEEIKPIIDQPIFITANQNGKTIQQPNTAEMSEILSAISFDNFFIQFANTPIAIGDSWIQNVFLKDLKRSIDIEYTYVEKNQENHRFSVKYLLDNKANEIFTMEGTALVNAKTLLIDNYTVEFNNITHDIQMKKTTKVIQ